MSICHAIYWTFTNFPPWYLSREDGWFVFAHITSNLVKDSTLTWGVVMRHVLRIFFSPDGWNLDRVGVRLYVEGVAKVKRARFQLFIADMKALNQICNSKSSSGATKPCAKCKNILGHCAVFEDPYLLHYSTPHVERFDEHTVGSYNAMVNHLKELHATADILVIDESIHIRKHKNNSVGYNSYV